MTDGASAISGRPEDVVEPEEDAVKAALGSFSEGIRNLDADRIVRVFFADANSFSVTARGVCIEPAARWPEIMAQAKADPNHLFRESFSVRILDVDVVGTVAAAKVEWVFQSARIVDFHNLLKVEGRWYIVNQVYHTFPALATSAG